MFSAHILHLKPNGPIGNWRCRHHGLTLLYLTEASIHVFILMFGNREPIRNFSVSRVTGSPRRNAASVSSNY